MIPRIAVALLCGLLLSPPAMARTQADGREGEGPPPPTPAAGGHLASARPLSLSRLLGLCGEVGKLMALERELVGRAPTPADIKVVSNATKCLAATSAIFETIRAMASMAPDPVVCPPAGVRDQDLLAGMLEWLEGLDEARAEDVFRLGAPQAFIAYINRTHPCGAGGSR